MFENKSELRNYSEELKELRLIVETEVSGDPQK